jgi:hypothetical protein
VSNLSSRGINRDGDRQRARADMAFLVMIPFMPKVRNSRYEDENLEDEAHIVTKNALVRRGIWYSKKGLTRTQYC